MVNIIPIKAFTDNYIWLLVNSQNKTAACVDPGDAKPILKALTELNLHLSSILITHYHADHCGGVIEILEHFSVPVYASTKEHTQGASNLVGDGDNVELPELNIAFKVIEIPAHTRGHIAYYGENSLLCGDTLFAAGCGRLFEGTAAEMFHSLNKLSQLPDTTQIYCGHEYTEANLRFALTIEPDNVAIQERIKLTQRLRQNNQPTLPSNLALEKATNPFLRCHEPAVIKAAENYIGHKLTEPVEVFAAIRKCKDNFS